MYSPEIGGVHGTDIHEIQASKPNLRARLHTGNRIHAACVLPPGEIDGINIRSCAHQHPHQLSLRHSEIQQF